MKTYLFLSLFLFSLSAFAQQKSWIDFNRNGKMDIYEKKYSDMPTRCL